MATFSQNVIINDKYKILELIGSGGMGTVYKAIDVDSDEIIAIKVLDYRGKIVESEVRFRGEFRAISRCIHPHVVSVRDFDSDGETLFIVMEYIDGADLRNFLIKKVRKIGQKAFDLPIFIEIFSQVCDALDYIHSQKIIHRDIKPENILIAPEKKAKIMDFGLSRILDMSTYITRTGEIMGTAAYISPEQGRGTKVDHRTDIYSLGVCMFEAATGSLPFSADNPIALLFQHIQDIPLSPRSLNPLVSSGLEKIIQRCMAKEPVDRYQRASEIIEDLQALLVKDDNENVQNEEISSPDIFSSFVKRPDFLFDPVFVNRKDEMRYLRELIIEVKNHRGNTIIIEGETGIGKTRLIAEALRSMKRVSKREPLLMVNGKCQENEQVPYKAITDCLRTLIAMSGILEDDQRMAKVEKWARILARLMPEFASQLSMKSEAKNNQNDVTETNQEKVKQILFQSVCKFLSVIANRKPVVMVIDNLQWADLATLELFCSLQSETPTMPLLLIGAYRLDESLKSFYQVLGQKQGLSGSFKARTVCLKPLSYEHMTEMIRSMLGSSQTPSEEFFNRVAMLSDGNPYFIREILQTSLAEGNIYRKEGMWQFDREMDGTFSLPSTIRRMITKRVQNLTPQMHRMLDYAAVLDVPFEVDIISNLMKIPRDQVFTILDDLVYGGLIVMNVEDKKEYYSFQHSLTKDIIYRKIKRQMQKRMHEEIARYLESLSTEKLDECAPRIASHFLQSNHRGRAVKYLIKTAEHAESIYAFESALRSYQNALEVIKEEGDVHPDYTEQRVSRELTRLLITQGKYKEATKIIEEAIVVSEDNEDIEELLQLLILKGKIAFQQSDYIKALEVWENATIASRKLHDIQTEALLLDSIGMVCLNLGQYEEAEKYIRDSLKKNVDTQSLAGQARNLHHLGTIHDTRCQFQEALANFEKSLALMTELGNEIGIGESYLKIGDIYKSRGLFREAYVFHQKAIELIEPLGIGILLHEAIMMAGLDLLYLADYEKALESFKKTYEYAFEHEEIILQIVALGYLSSFFKQIGDVKKAKKFAERSFQLIKSTGNRNYEPWINYIFASLALKKNDYPEALELANGSCEQSLLNGDLKIHLHALSLRAAIYYELYQNEEARLQCEKVLKEAQASGNEFVQLQMLYYLANIHIRAKDFAIGNEYVKNATLLYEKVESRELLWKILRTKARIAMNAGHKNAAIEYLKQAIETVELLCFTIKDVKLKKIYKSNKDVINLYSFVIALLLDSGKEEEAARFLVSAASMELKTFLFDEENKVWKGDVIAGILQFEQQSIL